MPGYLPVEKHILQLRSCADVVDDHEENRNKNAIAATIGSFLVEIGAIKMPPNNATKR